MAAKKKSSAPAPAAKPMTMKQFEKSPADKEKPGVKEGSKADKAMDKKQLAQVNQGMKQTTQMKTTAPAPATPKKKSGGKGKY